MKRWSKEQENSNAARPDQSWRRKRIIGAWKLLGYFIDLSVPVLLRTIFDRLVMAQNEAKRQKGITQKHLHSRVSYLYQAATYLAKVADQPRARDPVVNDESKERSNSVGEPHCAVAAPEAVSGGGLAISPIEQDIGTPRFDPDRHCLSKDFALSRQLVLHLRAISLRSQIRLSPAAKHAMCKRCDILLVPGSTSTSHMENKSRGGRKPWADVLVTTCTACGTSKRFPVGAKRQRRRKLNTGKVQNTEEQDRRAVD